MGLRDWPEHPTREGFRHQEMAEDATRRKTTEQKGVELGER